MSLMMEQAKPAGPGPSGNNQPGTQQARRETADADDDDDAQEDVSTAAAKFVV